MSPFEGDLKQAIIRASLQIGAEFGEDGLTMRGIASRLGVSATALYQHFDSKGAILRAIRFDGLKRLAESMHSERSNALDVLYDHSRCYVDFASKNPWLYTLMLGRETLDIETLSEEERALLKIPYDTIVRCCERAREEGSFSSQFDSSAGAMVLWAALHGVALLVISGRVRRDHPLYPVPNEDLFVDTFVHCVLHSFSSPQFSMPLELATNREVKPV